MDNLLNIYRYYAQCNKNINAGMFKIVKENGDIYNKKISGYYKSIGDILFHVFDVDLSWFSDLKGTIPSKIFEEEIFANFDESAEALNPYKNIHEFEKDRVLLDDLIIRFIDELAVDHLNKTIVYKNIKTKAIWEVLIHTFNHQTHHRGQISEILDENKIENDFSNMIRVEYIAKKQLTKER